MRNAYIVYLGVKIATINIFPNHGRCGEVESTVIHCEIWWSGSFK